jgi:uncharacterized protein YdhG (YjbR/CyaY superfamily)
LRSFVETSKPQRPPPKNHCAFYPGAHPIRAHENELAGYDLAKGTIRFPADKPLPAGLVKMLVKTRIAEYSA